MLIKFLMIDEVKKMDRSKVICHMYLSIDGKIDGDYMDEHGCDVSGEYYDKTIWEMGSANGNGRTTAEMYFAHEDIDYGKYDVSNIDYSDNVIKSDYYWVIFDRKGKCNWDTNKVTYGGKTALVVEILTKKVSKSFLAHLRAIGISYIIAGEDDLDLELALTKLKQLFGVDNLILCGGAQINGAFHKSGLLDELSLVIAPYIEGNHEEKGYAELDEFVNHKYVYKSIKPLGDGGVHLIFERK